MTHSVKLPIFLAVIAALVMPLGTFAYLGFYAVHSLGMLSIFSSSFTLLSLWLPFLLLISLWGNAAIFRWLWKSFPEESSEKLTLQRIWMIFIFATGILSLLTPLYSIFSDSAALHVAWSVIFCFETVAAICFGLCLLRIAHGIRHRFLFALGILISLSFVSDYSGLKMLQPIVNENLSAFESADSTDIISSLSGLSPSEFETLDDESIADVQEIFFSVFAIAAALVASLIAFHAAISFSFFILFAVYVKHHSPIKIS
ncbi:MAG: hypothetical protein SOZ02_06375 [Hallerella porci]|uniref:hypothetical protein n=1 Tax=Hallerella porci TaxID=1945871 RepID=UPI001567831B|nr:hypothetical protein [Hallerella porci]MDY3921772.1 hypothetical protein [Hallerella porci]